MHFNLLQVGPDDNPHSFKLKMRAYNIGKPGDALTINRFEKTDCQNGEAISVIDGGVRVQSKWESSNAYYNNLLKNTKLSDFSSLQLSD